MVDNKYERIDYMPGKRRYIYQRSDVFSFSMDAVLLAKFVTLPSKGKVIDLCAGNGAVPLMMSLRTNAEILGVEIQEPLCELANKSIQYNELEEQIRMVNQDITLLNSEVSWGKYDVVTCNPPYFPVTAEKGKNENMRVSLARHEIACSLEDIIRIASRLVKSYGKFAMVHRPERIVDIVSLMRMYKVEPKRIQYVHPKAGKEANMVFIEGVRDGRQGLKTLAPFFVYEDGQRYTKEFQDHYERS
ncbi:tRNA1(Val) (adenine(37)-N6)-methyltransferase [Bacillus shivajii]|uniref:tRNA1(Val) (adenine(37)-N6)-methyltransferase n=1 Tax=Bacillus shivajii TaxID=1983719 RepID=UPI001CFA5B42|nr:tRNA1(Val) (adenine(37)-N6)-methyltransferase [Bacillus shivajii]UCZ53294.1 tRNA1(Val) (adenine(37)-N6)-methyltransferase [Bacillus shivajii]